MPQIIMTFELVETWVRRPKPQMGEFLFWSSPSRARPDTAAHVYESLGMWVWYALTPTGHQADRQGKELTVEKAKAAALDALRSFADVKTAADGLELSREVLIERAVDALRGLTAWGGRPEVLHDFGDRLRPGLGDIMEEVRRYRSSSGATAALDALAALWLVS